MKLAEKILASLSQRRLAKSIKYINPDANKKGFDYAQMQYNKYLKRKMNFGIQDKIILEIGCGHGGISCFLAVNGAKKVYGLDINTTNLQTANLFKETIEQKRFGPNASLPVEFINQDVTKLDFPNETFDLIIADNVFEHFSDNIAVLKECYRVLQSNGQLVIPSTNSIYSKNGPHIKKGINIPWVNLFFSEQVILNVLAKNCEKYPILYDIYPGIKNDPKNFADIRRYKDLNYLTHKKLKEQIGETNLKIANIQIRYANGIAKRLGRMLPNKFSIIQDILSRGISLTLEKP